MQSFPHCTLVSHHPVRQHHHGALLPPAWLCAHHTQFSYRQAVHTYKPSHCSQGGDSRNMQEQHSWRLKIWQCWGVQKVRMEWWSKVRRQRGTDYKSLNNAYWQNSKSMKKRGKPMRTGKRDGEEMISLWMYCHLNKLKFSWRVLMIFTSNYILKSSIMLLLLCLVLKKKKGILMTDANNNT